MDEDRSTPVFSPYSGRVTKLLASPGDTIVSGQLLFVIEATDMVQAENDFIAGIGAINKAHSQLAFAEADVKRFRALSKDKAVAARDAEQAEIALVGAQNDAVPRRRHSKRLETGCAFSAKQTTRSKPSRQPEKSARKFRSLRRSAAPSCSARSGPDNTSTAARPTRSMSSAISRRYGWSPMCARRKRPKIRVGQPISFSLLAYPGRHVSGKHSIRGDDARPGNAAPDGARQYPQPGWIPEARNVRHRQHFHRRRRRLAGCAARRRCSTRAARRGYGWRARTRRSSCDRSRWASLTAR